ncbi:LuxR family transcriptional regulator [Herbiconiux sp.]|uniref:helix-turn-helix transcriptional regulator n=1 Tax=Herbiconiux sp. TaxID=1871186 RepID=UPI0025BFD763|nr:LuxR family transcriptional regulator [Herbiconiux sp.]
MSPSSAVDALRAALSAHEWDAVLETIEKHWAVLTQTDQALLVEAINALPGPVLEANPRFVAAKTYANYLPINGDVRPLRFQHTVAAGPGGLLDQLADLTSRSVSARFQGNPAQAVAFVREAHAAIAEVSDDALAAIRPVLPDIRLQWAMSLELGGELVDAARAYERTFDEALTFDNRRIAVKAAGALALNYALAGNQTAAEQWLSRRPKILDESRSAVIDTVLTRGDLAQALMAAHDLRFDDARAALDAAPSADVDREAWALRLFVESVLARASGRARQQLSRVGAAMASQPERVRTTGLNGWLTTMATAELQLAIGDVEAAGRTIGHLRVLDLPAANDPVRVLRAWAALRRGDAEGAVVLVGPGLAEPLTSARITVELLMIAAAANLQLEQPAEAQAYFQAAMDLIISEGLFIVLLRLTAAERTTLLAGQPASLPPRVVQELDSLGGAPTPPKVVQLSERERVVLRHLMAAPSLHAIAAAEHVSHNTVKSQVKSIYRKLGVTNRDDAIRVVASAPHLLA